MTTSVPGPIAVISHYNLLERLAPAGPGELFRARDTRKGRTVVVRVLPEEYVADAHACGYVHGGLSPDSVVITAKGHAKIPAFALASREGFAAPGEATLHDYDSPEEARGLPSDERSDIYSVCAVLFEMLTGRRPLHRGAAAPSANNRHVPPELDEVVLKAVAPN